MKNYSLPPNPYVGLRPFEERESLLFFGRDAHVDQLVQKLHENHFLAVVGSSGSGKSSLVRAGLFPRLRAGLMVEARPAWHIAAMKPGADPLRNLAAALQQVLDPAPDADAAGELHAALAEWGAKAVLEYFSPMLRESNGNLLILADQFEELFRYAEQTDAGEAAAFVELLLSLAAQKELPIYVTLTMRTDFLGDCDAFAGLPEALNRGQFLVPRLTRAQRRQAILGPARLYETEIAQPLLDELLNQTGDEHDQLPILQHALLRIWDHAGKNGHSQLDLEAYDAVGGLGKALSRHADEAFESLSDDQQEHAEALFRALTLTDHNNRRIRRPARWRELRALTGAGDEALRLVADRFCDHGRNFLVLTQNDDDATADISHESLIRQWRRLRDWVDAEAEDRETYQRLVETHHRFAEGRDDLLTGTALELAQDWLKNANPSPTWAQRAVPDGDLNAVKKYIAASRAAWEAAELREQKRRDERERLLRERAELAEREAAQQKERERLLQERADMMARQTAQQRKTLRQTRIFSVVMALLLMLAAAAAWLAFENSRRARDNTLLANLNLAKAHEEKALAALEANDFKQMWLNTDIALRQDIPPDSLPLTNLLAGRFFADDAQQAAFNQRWFSPTAKMAEGPVYSVAFSPDGARIVSGSDDQSVRLWDAASGAEIRRLEGHTGTVWSVAFSPDGARIVSGSDDQSVRLWPGATPHAFFLQRGEPTSLYEKFAEGVLFVWQLERQGLRFVPAKPLRTMQAQNGYHFQHEDRFAPLLKPPASGQSKYDQILAWAQAQLAAEK